MRRDLADRLGGLECIEHVGRSDRGGKRSKAFRVGWRTMVGAVPGQPEDPATALLGEQEECARVTGAGSDQHEFVARERVGRQR